MRIVFPELNNPNIQQTLSDYTNLQANPNHPSSPQSYPPIEAVPASDLTSACQLITSGTADAMIAGIDYSSRDVILACRDQFDMAKIPAHFSKITRKPAYSTFSGLAVMQRKDKTYLLADMAACKHPSPEQILEIIVQTIISATKILSEPPRVALLSFSTAGSGGRDDTITLMQDALATLKPLSDSTDLPFYIDGEIQLDAAINPKIGAKKFPNSPVAGQANVLIAPDLNSGNLLYKSFEQLAGFTVAGPILQGFNFPVSDLSRGSTVADILLTIKSLTRLAQA